MRPGSMPTKSDQQDDTCYYITLALGVVKMLVSADIAL